MAENAGTAVLVEIAKKAIQPAVDATVRQFGYLLCYTRNIDNLKGKVEELKRTREDAENLWDSFRDNNEETTHTGTAWVDKAKAVETAANDIMEATEKLKKGCLCKWCPNPKDRYLLSRNAIKKAEEIQQLQIQGRAYLSLTKPALPPSKLTGALANDCSKDFKTRVKIMDDIIDALKDDAISIVGICGLGGVGKTTLMHELRERVKVDNLFDEVVMATVSQNPDLFNIQSKLAEMLGLTLGKDGKNEIAKADELRKRLTIEGRRILVILDDIWSDIKLEELGIPAGSDQKGCKVVLTSRQVGVCTNMRTHRTIPVGVLPEEEAWDLFRKNAGDCVEREDLKEIAKEVADECGGLPIALVTLAKALSNKKIEVWLDARKQLRESSVTRIPDMEKIVYSRIMLSYNFLASQLPETQPLLLLCCQHPEDAEIKVEKLARYCLALRLFKNVDTVQEARNGICSLIEYLKSCFLLQAVDDHDVGKDSKDERVKVHDVVRDVCLSIVSRVKEERDRVYMHIMAGKTDQHGTSAVEYAKLKVIMEVPLDGDFLSINFLQQMEELRVLESSSGRKSHPPPALHALTNLRMLSLENGVFPEGSMLAIGSLMNLEILSLLGSSIRSLPRQIGQLSNLKFLDLRCGYQDYGPIPRGILPGLNKLEELYMGGYYFVETPENGEEGACGERHEDVSELDFLSNLTTLQTPLQNPIGLLSLQCFDFKKLERFLFGLPRHFSNLRPFSTNGMILERAGMNWVLGAKIQPIVERTVELDLSYSHWHDPLLLSKFVNLRYLYIYGCYNLKSLIHDGGAAGGGSSSCGNSKAFMNVERLCIMGMNSLEELCRNGNLPARSLGKLRYLRMEWLPEVRQLWVGPTDPLCLVNLTEVKIVNCGALECIFPHSAVKCLVELQILTVKGCGSLEGIVSKGKETATERGGGEIIGEPSALLIHFPKLRHVTIECSHNVQGFYNLGHDDDRVRPLLNPLVMLPSMVNLKVERLHRLKQIVGGWKLNVPTFAASDCLQNLEEINVRVCDLLESVFGFDEEQQVTGEKPHALALGKLQLIRLQNLQNLTHVFHPRMQDIHVPELKNMKVSYCRRLVNVAESNMLKVLQNLKRVSLITCEAMKTVFDFEGLEIMKEDAPPILGELEDIDLSSLPNLKHVCRLVPKDIHAFQKLRKLTVTGCGSLSYLISSSMAHMLVNLESLSIESCMSMKEVVCKMNEDSRGEKKIVFHSLKQVKLEDLERLSSFCSSDQLELEFPSLEKLSIINCPEMKTLLLPNTYGNPREGVVSKGREGTTKGGRGGGGTKDEPNIDLVVQLPKLKEVILQGTPNLRGFYNLDNDNGSLHPLFNPSVLGTSSKLVKPSLTQLVFSSSSPVVRDGEKLPSSSGRNSRKAESSSPNVLSHSSSFTEQSFCSTLPARRDACKAAYDALMQEWKEFYGRDGFDMETSLGDGVLN